MSSTLAHSGLPEGVKQQQLASLAKRVARAGDPDSRVSQTALALLEHFVFSCRESDFQPGRICGSWEQPSTIAAKLGISSKVFHNAEAELRKKGLIERTSNPHARRQGERRNGQIVSLAGISLRPLIDGYERLVAKRDAIALRQQAVSDIQHEIAQLRRQIREANNPGISGKAEVILPRGRTSRITRMDRLCAIKADLKALLVFIDVPCSDAESSDQTEEIVTPNILKKDSSKNRSSAPHSKCRPYEPTSFLPAIAERLGSEDYQVLLMANGGPTWPSIVETSAAACSWLGISQQVWGEACAALGRERAALCVVVIDRNWRLPDGHRYRARIPKDCLAGMSKQSRAGQFNLSALVNAHHESSLKTPPSLGQTDAGPSFAGISRRIISTMQIGDFGGRP
jgi:replication initiation protein RepC